MWELVNLQICKFENVQMEGMDIMFENLFLLAPEERPVYREDLGGLLRNILIGLLRNILAGLFGI